MFFLGSKEQAGQEKQGKGGTEGQKLVPLDDRHTNTEITLIKGGTKMGEEMALRP